MSLPELRPHQIAAAEFLARRRRGALFMEMRTGKTATVLAHLAAHPERLPALVIAPLRVATSAWPADAPTWAPSLLLEVITSKTGSADRRQALLREPLADITVLPSSLLADADAAVGGSRTKPEPAPWRTLVIDESSTLRSTRTERSKAMRRLAAACEGVILLTGTPQPSSIEDLWGQIVLIDGGQRLGQSLTAFRSRFMDAGRRLPSGAVIGREALPGAQEEVLRLISDVTHTVRLADTDMEVAAAIHVDHQVPVDDQTWAVYERLRREYVAYVGGTQIDAPSAAVLSSRLSQVLGGQVLYDDGLHEVSPARPRVEAAMRIAEGVERGTVIVYRYLHERHAVLEACAQRGWSAADVRDAGALERWSAGELDVLVLHPASGGHGLNLQHGGHTMAWISPVGSVEQWQQTSARLDRPGQTHPVTVHRLLCTGPKGQASVDAHLARVQEGRADLMAEALEYLRAQAPQ